MATPANRRLGMRKTSVPSAMMIFGSFLVTFPWSSNSLVRVMNVVNWVRSFSVSRERSRVKAKLVSSVFPL